MLVVALRPLPDSCSSSAPMTSRCLGVSPSAAAIWSSVPALMGEKVEAAPRDCWPAGFDSSNQELRPPPVDAGEDGLLCAGSRNQPSRLCAPADCVVGIESPGVWAMVFSKVGT